MPTNITGTDAWNKTVAAPAPLDPGNASDIQTIVQRALNNDYWAASRLSGKWLLVSQTIDAVTDASSSWPDIDSNATTSWADATTFSVSPTVAIGDLVVGRFQGTLQTSTVSGAYSEARLIVTDGVTPTYSAHQRIVNNATSGTAETTISLESSLVVADTQVDVDMQIRASASGTAKLIGSGRLIVSVFRPVADPGL